MTLLTLQNAKDQLNISDNNSDVELQSFVDSVVSSIEFHCGPVDSQTITEELDGERVIVTGQVPVLSVTSVTSIWPSGPTWTTAAGQLHFDPDTGVIRRSDRFDFYLGPFTVVYQAGRSSVPASLNLAARIIVQHLWQTQRGPTGRPGLGAQNDTQQLPGWGYAIPNRAVALMEPFARDDTGVA